MRRLLPLIGPGLVAGVAYVDPGNVASNMSAGATFGFLLLWVVVLGNLIAWLVQYLSAKLGIVTGKSLPQLIGERIRNRWARRAFWVQAELVAMATDLAEVLGGAIALYLLFGIPLVWGGLITGALSLGILALHSRARGKIFERIIIGLLVVIAVGFSIGVFVNPPDPAAFAAGLIPGFDGVTSVLLAASILGATVMPHAVYAHSALTRDRFGLVASGPRRRDVLRATRWDVTIALVVAGAVNIAILVVGAGFQGAGGIDDIFTAYASIAVALGSTIAIFFGIALLASGLASTSVGAYAGGEIMSGLLNIRVPLIWRRVISIIPAIVILALGVNPLLVLIISQVVLSFGISFALIPLIRFTRNRALMGDGTNSRGTTALALVATALIIALNVALIVLSVTGMG
jgi:manganese transport protein